MVLGNWIHFFILLLKIVSNSSFQRNFRIKTQRQTNHVVFANPVNADGNRYRGLATEEEAFMWFDEAVLRICAGTGGEGSNSFKFGKMGQRLGTILLVFSSCSLQTYIKVCSLFSYQGPTGGSGGNGGNVVLVADEGFNTLFRFKGRADFKAEEGANGDNCFANGRYGSDCFISVPPGTIVKDNTTNYIIGALKYPGDKLVVAKGGRGGTGNAAVSLKASTSKRLGRRPSPQQSPQRGESRCLKLELQLVADLGLVGVPNAGKSSLLNALTNARPKIAAYPFTTIVPNLGVCDVDALTHRPFDSSYAGLDTELSCSADTLDSTCQGSGAPVSGGTYTNTNTNTYTYTGSSGAAGAGAGAGTRWTRRQQSSARIGTRTLVLADIPGLLPGAHRGVGLGRGFLRHIERCSAILHVVDGDSADPVGDYNAINRELLLYSPALAAKPQVVVLTKADLPGVAARQQLVLQQLRGAMSHARLLTVSATQQTGLVDLVTKTAAFLDKIKLDSDREMEHCSVIQRCASEETMNLPQEKNCRRQ
jgi:GTPase involved in cell partitioning and DNA repair